MECTGATKSSRLLHHWVPFWRTPAHELPRVLRHHTQPVTFRSRRVASGDGVISTFKKVSRRGLWLVQGQRNTFTKPNKLEQLEVQQQASSGTHRARVGSQNIRILFTCNIVTVALDRFPHRGLCPAHPDSAVFGGAWILRRG